jgi:hypothetical protein
MGHPDETSDTEFCGHCGERLPPGAIRCRNCGYSEADLEPDPEQSFTGEDDFDYDDFIAREFPAQADPESDSVRRRAIVRLVVLLIIVSFVIAAAF